MTQRGAHLHINDEFNRASMKGKSLSPENAARLEFILVRYMPWLDNAVTHVHRGENFTVSFQPGTEYLFAPREERLEKQFEFAQKLLHFNGRSLANTSLSMPSPASHLSLVSEESRYFMQY